MAKHGTEVAATGTTNAQIIARLAVITTHIQGVNTTSLRVPGTSCDNNHRPLLTRPRLPFPRVQKLK